jgi:hypothetical protein
MTSAAVQGSHPRQQPVGQGRRFLFAGTFAHALLTAGEPAFEVGFYAEHSLGSGTDATAIAYIEAIRSDGSRSFGAGTDTSIELASVKALLSALNRFHLDT